MANLVVTKGGASLWGAFFNHKDSREATRWERSLFLSIISVSPWHGGGVEATHACAVWEARLSASKAALLWSGDSISLVSYLNLPLHESHTHTYIQTGVACARPVFCDHITRTGNNGKNNIICCPPSCQQVARALLMHYLGVHLCQAQRRFPLRRERKQSNVLSFPEKQFTARSSEIVLFYESRAERSYLCVFSPCRGNCSSRAQVL